MTAIAIDTETTGPFLHHGCAPFTVTACDEDGNEFIWEFKVNPYTRVVNFVKSVIKKIKRVLSRYKEWVFHNALFDIRALEILGIEVPKTTIIHDTMLMAHCYNSLDKLGLKGLAYLYLNYPEDDEKELDAAVTKARHYGRKHGLAIAEPEHPHLTPLKEKKGKCDFWLPKTLLTLPTIVKELTSDFKEKCKNVCDTYAMGDVARTIGLYMYYKKFLIQRGDWDHYIQNNQCIIPTHGLQSSGFTLKADKLPGLIHKISQRKAKVRNRLETLSNIEEFNPRSNPQLQRALFQELDVVPTAFNQKSGNPSTDKAALNNMLRRTTFTKDQALFVRSLLTYRQLNTAESYLASYQRFEKDHKLYTSLNPTGTTTVRYASRNPNAQNISKQTSDEDNFDLTFSINLREAFGPPKGKLWICIDYAQLQLVIFAHACKDTFLIDAFANGLDIHDLVAREVFGTEQPTSLERRAAKAINFGIIFGAGRNKIERMSGIDGSYDMFRERFPLVQQYLNKCQKEVRTKGYVRTLGGYPLRVQKRKAYKGCNFVVQGTEGEMIKRAINHAYKYCLPSNVPIKPVMLVHDEIIFETKRNITKDRFLQHHSKHVTAISQLMVQAGNEVNVAVNVDGKITDTTWAHAKSLPEDIYTT